MLSWKITRVSYECFLQDQSTLCPLGGAGKKPKTKHSLSIQTAKYPLSNRFNKPLTDFCLNKFLNLGANKKASILVCQYHNSFCHCVYDLKR